MTRRKVKLDLIPTENERKISYKKRKKGLMKKVEELSTLCGIDACAIIYGPYDDEPEIWPPSPDAVQDLLSRFKMLPEKYKKIVNEEDFSQKRVDKMHEQIKKKEKDNREKELTDIIYRCLGGEQLEKFRGVVDFNEMDRLIERKLKEVCQKIELLKKHITQPSLTEMPLQTNSSGGTNEFMAAPGMPVNEMQNFTWFPTNSPMVASEIRLNEMQNVTWCPTYASMVAPEMHMNEMQNVTWSTNNASMMTPWSTNNNASMVAPWSTYKYNGSMVAPHGTFMNEMQNATWSANNASMVATEMLTNEMQNVTWSTNNPEMHMNEMQNVTWSTNVASMGTPEMLINDMQNVTWSTNNASMVAPEMTMNDMQNATWSTNNASMLAPQMTMNDTQNVTWATNNASMVSPEMPMNQMQTLTRDMDMLSIDQQPWLSGFMWDDHFFQSIMNNNGAGPSNSVP